jgi:chemotaxis signal transduction protein
MVVGLQVDAVHEVFARRADEVEGVPNLGTSIDPHFLAGMTRAAGQVIGILSLATVVEVESLTAAIAGQAPH